MSGFEGRSPQKFTHLLIFCDHKQLSLFAFLLNIVQWANMLHLLVYAGGNTLKKYQEIRFGAENTRALFFSVIGTSCDRALNMGRGKALTMIMNSQLVVVVFLHDVVRRCYVLCCHTSSNHCKKLERK